jgi:hypothetical protein
MQKIKLNRLFFIIVLILVPAIIGCNQADENTYKIFTLDEGTVHFSFEYRTYFQIKEVEPGENTGVPTQDIAYVTLIGPFIKEAKDYTSINVIADKPDKLIPDAKSGIERAERNASSFPDYKLLYKSEMIIDNVPAYRIDYTHRNIQPIDRGLSKPPFEVYREVDFDSKGFVWMIQMRSDSTTAEDDKPNFEHIIKTFKILD